MNREQKAAVIDEIAECLASNRSAALVKVAHSAVSTTSDDVRP